MQISKDPNDKTELQKKKIIIWNNHPQNIMEKCTLFNGQPIICMYVLLYMYLICTFFLCCNESKIKLSIKLKVRNIHRKTTGTHALIGWEMGSHEGIYVQKSWHKFVMLCMHWSSKHNLKNIFGWIPNMSTFFLTDETWKIFANVLY